MKEGSASYLSSRARMNDFGRILASVREAYSSLRSCPICFSLNGAEAFWNSVWSIAESGSILIDLRENFSFFRNSLGKRCRFNSFDSDKAHISLCIFLLASK